MGSSLNARPAGAKADSRNAPLGFAFPPAAATLRLYASVRGRGGSFTDFLLACGPVHGTLLVKHRLHIFENICCSDLAADKADALFFVLAAPRFAGAVQSVVHPVAIR